jgi:hypothetical protein
MANCFNFSQIETPTVTSYGKDPGEAVANLKNEALQKCGATWGVATRTAKKRSSTLALLVKHTNLIRLAELLLPTTNFFTFNDQKIIKFF